jgi:hypothetical protein
MAITKKLIKSPQQVIYNIILLMQQWKMLLLPDKEQDMVKKAIKKLKRKVGAGHINQANFAVFLFSAFSRALAEGSRRHEG